MMSRRLPLIFLHGACHALLCYRNDAVPNPLGSSGCPGMAIDRDRLVAVSVPDAQGAPLHHFHANSAMRIPFLNYAPDAFLGKVTASLLNEAIPRLNLELRYESAFAEAVRAHALAGAGVAWLPRSTIERNLGDGSLFRVGGVDWDIPLTVELLRRKKRLSPAAESIWTLLANGVATARPVLHSATTGAHRPARGRA